MKILHLTRGKVAYVDDEDFENLKQYKWHACANGYGARCWGGRILYLHDEIMGTSPIGKRVDHIDRCEANNQRSNLRFVDRIQNNANRRKGHGKSSRFKGVCWDKSKKKWVALIKLYGRSRHLGRFASEVDAARAYDIAARSLFGEYAATNEDLKLYEKTDVS